VFVYIWRLLVDGEQGCTLYASFLRNNALAGVTGVVLPQVSQRRRRLPDATGWLQAGPAASALRVLPF
jgi:hypothetical protein